VGLRHVPAAGPHHQRRNQGIEVVVFPLGTAVGNGTPAIGFVPGTGCLLGLPVRLAGTTDVVHIGMNAGTGAVTVNGGTVAGFVNSTVHAIRPPAALSGTQAINVWVKPTLITEGTLAASLSQAT